MGNMKFVKPSEKISTKETIRRYWLAMRGQCEHWKGVTNLVTGINDPELGDYWIGRKIIKCKYCRTPLGFIDKSGDYFIDPNKVGKGKTIDIEMTAIDFD